MYMGWIAALISTSVLVILWFWEVRRCLREQHSMVESARSQMDSCRRRAAGSSGDADSAQVLRRCEDIYRQAAEHYNNTLRRPLIHVPGYLMGFHREPDMPECGCGTSQKTA